MPITFGAVGDIISVCLLVKDLVDALDKARGSKAEYQSLVRELRILDRVLLEIDLLCRTHEGGATPELEALCKTARQAVDRCKDLVRNFLNKIKRYQNTFENPISKSNFVKDAALKLRWRVGEEEAVEQFRVEIAGTSSSLQMLLATASVKLIDLKGNWLEKRMAVAQQKNESTLNDQNATLRAVQSRLEDTNRLISAGNAVTKRIADALRLDWIRQLGDELKGLLRRVFAMNIATYHAVISIQSALPSHLERGLIEEPFVLEDAIGRVAPVHLQFVTSWEAFHAVLEIRFKGVQGFKKVREKQYGLQEKATQRDIEQSRPWQRAFLPGQRIEMSILFDSKENGDHKCQKIICPGCRIPSTNSTDAEIKCEDCGMWFRRITVVEDVDPPPHTPLPTPWRMKAQFGKSAFTDKVYGPVRPMKKRAMPADVHDEDDVREFKRVRLIAKRKRIRQQLFGQNLSMNYSDVFSISANKLGMEHHAGTASLKAQALKTSSQRDGENTNPENVSTVDHAEIVKAELEKVRQIGLLSKPTQLRRSDDPEPDTPSPGTPRPATSGPATSRPFSFLPFIGSEPLFAHPIYAGRKPKTSPQESNTQRHSIAPETITKWNSAMDYDQLVLDSRPFTLFTDKILTTQELIPGFGWSEGPYG